MMRLSLATTPIAAKVPNKCRHTIFRIKLTVHTPRSVNIVIRNVVHVWEEICTVIQSLRWFGWCRRLRHQCLSFHFWHSCNPSTNPCKIMKRKSKQLLFMTRYGVRHILIQIPAYVIRFDRKCLLQKCVTKWFRKNLLAQNDCQANFYAPKNCQKHESIYDGHCISENILKIGWHSLIKPNARICYDNCVRHFSIPSQKWNIHI